MHHDFRRDIFYVMLSFAVLELDYFITNKLCLLEELYSFLLLFSV